MDDFSDKQRRIYDFICAFLEENGYPPTIRDIQHGCQISSTSVVDYNLNALRRKGYLRRRADVSRGIELVGYAKPRPQVETVAVPLVGSIAAGVPLSLPSSESWQGAEVQEMIELPQAIVGRGEGLYGLRVKGDSMTDALIADGDLVVMQQTSQVENGEMAAVRLKAENETTLKKFYAEGPVVRLQPANSMMAPLRVPADNVEVLSRVVAVWRYLG